MKKLLFIAVAMCLAACSSNDTTSYTLIKEMKDGSKQEEKFSAENDSAAMMHLVEIGIQDQGKTIVRGTLLNYKGDTLNTKENASKMMEKTLGVSEEKIDKTLELADSAIKALEGVE